MKTVQSAVRAAIYARYSSDQQRSQSIDDQVRICRKRAEQLDAVIVVTHYDEAISGSTRVGMRPGGKLLLDDAANRRFDVLVVEGLDRLSRDSLEQETIVRRLEYLDIRIVGVSDGYDSTSKARKLHRGMRGLINEIYLDDLRDKTHRTMQGQVDRGLVAGAPPYGYRSVKVDGGKIWEIDDEQASWVRWIFERFVDGWGCRSIAHELNRLRVPSPRGSTWAVSAIYGHQKKGTGILNNQAYNGIYIWNRSQWIKDPDTGRRRRVERPEHEVTQPSRPEIKIVSDELWAAVKTRQAEKRLEGGTKGRSAPVKSLLAGIMHCGCCGGPIIAINSTRYGCAWHQDRGGSVCNNSTTVKRDVAEDHLVTVARDELLTPDAIRVLQQEVTTLLRRFNEERIGATASGRKRLAELDQQIDNLTNAVASIGLSEALSDRLRAAEKERAAVQAELRADDLALPKLPERIPALMQRYRALLDDFPNTLKRNTPEARKALASVLGEVKLVPENGRVIAEIPGPGESLKKL